MSGQPRLRQEEQAAWVEGSREGREGEVGRKEKTGTGQREDRRECGGGRERTPDAVTL